MMSDSEASGYTPGDAPITDATEDLLGRDALAEVLATQVLSPRDYDGFVLGVTGTWGSGKTSLLLLLEKHLRPEDVVVRFNPWLYSGTAELVSRFLADVRAQLPNDKRYATAREALGRYAGVLTPLGALAFLTPVLPAVAAAAGVVKGVKDAFNRSAEEERDRVREALKQLPGRVVVFVDDLDRLAPNEVAEMVRLVKLVGDFPKTSYVLAYERNYVEEALTKVFGGSGRAYLEKVVQATQPVPHLEPHVLARLLDAEVGAALAGLAVESPLSRQRWPAVKTSVVGPLMRTVRDIRRLANVLPAAFRLTGPDVDAVDVVALEAMRLFLPDVHQALPRTAGALTRSSTLDFLADRKTSDKAAVEALIDTAGDDEQGVVRAAIRALFPAAERHLSNTTYADDERQLWRKERRVASLPGLLTYLTKVVGENAVNAATTNEAIAVLGQPRAFSELTADLTARQLEDLLRRLADFGDEVDGNTIPRAVGVLFNQLPRLAQEPCTLFDPSLEALVAPLADGLLSRLATDARAQAAEDAYSAIRPFYGRFRFVQLFGDHGEDQPNNHPRFDAAVTARLRARLRDELLAAAGSDLAGETQLPRLLHLLVAEAGEAGRERLRSLLDDCDFLLHVLVRFASREDTVDAEGTPLHRGPVTLDYDSLADIVGPEELSQRVQRLGARARRAELNEDERSVLALAVERAEDPRVSSDG